MRTGRLCKIIPRDPVQIKHRIYLLNPLVPIKVHEKPKIWILRLEGIIKKNSYERNDYESVDEKSLS